MHRDKDCYRVPPNAVHRLAQPISLNSGATVCCERASLAHNQAEITFAKWVARNIPTTLQLPAMKES